MGDTAAEMLAKEMQAIVAADRWKGRDLSAAPPEKWSHLRPETQQFWIDTAARILAALPAASSDDEKLRRTIAARDRRIERLVQALEDARAQGYVTQAEMEPPIVLSEAPAEDAQAEALKEALDNKEQLDIWAQEILEGLSFADVLKIESYEDKIEAHSVIGRGIVEVLRALIPEAKP